MVNTIVEKEPEFIETQYTKLEGPKIVSKIDISQFDKPKQKLSVDAKGKSDDVTDDDKKKKKRKRLKKESLSEGLMAQNQNKGADKKDKDKPKKDKKDKNKKPIKKKQEIDDAEIEKQIRETLARLSPLGKSKTSKHRREKRQTVHQHIEEEQIREAESKNILKVYNLN